MSSNQQQRRWQRPKEQLLSAIELGEKQADDLDIGRNSDVDGEAGQSSSDGESSGEELEGVFSPARHGTASHQIRAGSPHQAAAAIRTLGNRSNHLLQSPLQSERNQHHHSKQQTTIPPFPTSFSIQVPQVNVPTDDGTIELKAHLSSSSTNNLPMRKLTRERRMELLQQRRAKRELRSRRQIDRQVKEQARKTETNTDRSALQFSGWGVDHGYTGVAFSAPMNPTSKDSKARQKERFGSLRRGKMKKSMGSIGSSNSSGGSATNNRINKAPKKTLAELESLETKIAAEMQKTYDALRRMREGPSSNGGNNEPGNEGEAYKETKNVLVLSFRLPFKLERDGSSWVASAWQNETFDSQLMDQCRYPCTWIGWPGVAVDVGEQEHVRDNLLVNRDYVPVFVRAEELDLCYAGFCKEVLWPLMHSRALTTKFHIEANAEGQTLRSRRKGSGVRDSSGMRSRTTTFDIKEDDVEISSISLPATPSASFAPSVLPVSTVLDVPSARFTQPTSSYTLASSEMSSPLLTPNSRLSFNSSMNSADTFSSSTTVPNITTAAVAAAGTTTTTPVTTPVSTTNTGATAAAASAATVSTPTVGRRSVSARSSGSDPHQMRDMWMAYVSTTERFAETVREVYEDGDMIWVHGYHLMLAPSMIRAYLPNATIGFNMHIPFPTSEIFRVLPWRREILQGMLDADFIGFQVPGHARHFVHCCTRILLGTSSTSTHITYRGHVTRLLVCPVGVDLRRLGTMQRRRAVRDRASVLQNRFQRRFVIVGVDRCVQTSGIVQKLMGFEEFLIRNPKLSEIVVLVQIVLPMNQRFLSEEGKSLRRRIDQVVGRTNARFAKITSVSRPIYCLHQDIGSDDLLGLYETSDCALVTPVKEGMNTIPFEYLICRDNRGMPGTVIVSEFAGCASSLSGAIIVNPASTDAMATAIAEALTMDEKERKQRHSRMSSIASMFTAQNWLHNCTKMLDDVLHDKENELRLGGRRKRTLDTLLKEAVVKVFAESKETKDPGAKEKSKQKEERMGEKSVKSATIAAEQIATKQDAATKAVANVMANAAVTNAVTDAVTNPLIDAMANATIRTQLVLLDYEDVIVQAQSLAEMTTMMEHVRKVLLQLCRNRKDIQVMIMSTRGRDMVRDLLIGVPCWLSAEHGHVVRLSNDHDAPWEVVVPKHGAYNTNGNNSPLRLIKQSWFATIVQIFRHYGGRTPGAVVEVTPVSISLHFEDADKNYATTIAKQLLSTLTETIGGFPIKAHLGRRSVDVIHYSVDKTDAVRLALQKMCPNETKQNSDDNMTNSIVKVDTVLCVLTGHEATDENLFKMLSKEYNIGALYDGELQVKQESEEAPAKEVQTEDGDKKEEEEKKQEKKQENEKEKKTAKEKEKKKEKNYGDSNIEDGETKNSNVDRGSREGNQVKQSFEEDQGSEEQSSDNVSGSTTDVPKNIGTVESISQKIEQEVSIALRSEQTPKTFSKEEKRASLVTGMAILCTMNEQSSTMTTNATFVIENPQKVIEMLDVLGR